MEKALKYINSSLSEHRNPDILKKKQLIEREIKEKKLLEQLDPEAAEKSKTLGNEAYKKGIVVHTQITFSIQYLAT